MLLAPQWNRPEERAWAVLYHQGSIDIYLNIAARIYNDRMRKESLQRQIEKIKTQLLALGPMRPGHLSQQYTACQKPGCKCVDPVRPEKHGPFYKLSYTQGGKGSTLFVRPQFVPEARRQLETYQKFKSLTQQWVSLALELSKLELQEARAATPKKTRARKS